jgi:hypothetical protein
VPIEPPVLIVNVPLIVVPEPGLSVPFIVKSLKVVVPVKLAEPENKTPLQEPVKVPLFVKDPPSAKVSVLLPLMVNVAPELIVTSAAFADAPIAGE